jgi:hypothetical protein
VDATRTAISVPMTLAGATNKTSWIFLVIRKSFNYCLMRRRTDDCINSTSELCKFWCAEK